MTDTNDVWTRLAAPLPQESVAWRQDGKPSFRDGKYFARFVCYVEAGTVRERLDAVVPGEWDLRLKLLPQQTDDDGVPMVGFRARINVLGITREDVGQGKDYKSAATDAFKRAAVRFGIGHELYQYEQNWVQVDSDSKYAKPVEDPGEAYARRHVKGSGAKPVGKESQIATGTAQTRADGGLASPAQQALPASPLASDEASCPKCGGANMYDNRLTKRNPKAPDFKCRNRSCDGVIWPPKNAPAFETAPPDDSDQIPF